MPDTMQGADVGVTSPGRDRVVRAYRRLKGSASDEAAHQRMRRTTEEVLDMVRLFAREGAMGRIMRLQVLIAEAMQVEQRCTTDAHLVDSATVLHHIDQSGDTARFILAQGATPATEERMLRAAYAELAELQQFAALLEARKAARA